MRVAFCEGCGAPLDAAWNEIVVVCRYCSAHASPVAPGEPVPPVMPDDGRPRLSVDGRTYVLEERLAQGESTDVFRGRWVSRLGELVVLKVQRALADTDLVRREHTVLRRLHDLREPGWERLASRVPLPIALGPLRGGTRSARAERLVVVHPWRSGFVHTLDDVAAAYPGGVPPAVGTWMLKRLLEVLAWLHRSGVVHGAVLPRHVLVHPFEHGAILCGFSLATEPGAPMPGLIAGQEAAYPSRTWRTRRAVPADDLAMAARAVSTVCRWPGKLGSLVDAMADGSHPDAWAARAELDAAAAEELGPPRWHPLTMPGWGRRSG